MINPVKKSKKKHNVEVELVEEDDIDFWQKGNELYNDFLERSKKLGSPYLQ